MKLEQHLEAGAGERTNRDEVENVGEKQVMWWRVVEEAQDTTSWAWGS